MPVYRAILKKTTYFKKGNVSERNGRYLNRYLSRYVDEVAKAQQKAGERTQKKHSTTESIWLLPEESSGKIWTGGFFGENLSSGNTNKEKQKTWIKAFTEEWLQILTTKSRRRNDGFRFIIGMSPQSVKDLTLCGKSVDQAMREIWRETIALYRKRHNLEAAEEELGWVAGAHHDTDNTHLHVVLFPTTLSGTPLRTNNGRVTSKGGRVDDLNDLIAITNIACEIYWRENMPFEYQAPDYKNLVALNPTGEEPSLPSIEDYPAKSGIPSVINKNTTPNFNKYLLDEAKDAEIQIAYEREGVLDRTRRKAASLIGVKRLKAYTGIGQIWKDKKTKFPAILKMVGKKDEGKKLAEILEKEFELESTAFSRLTNYLSKIKSKKAKKILKSFENKDSQWAEGLLSFVAGNQQEVSDEITVSNAGQLAQVYDASLKPNDTEQKLKGMISEGEILVKETKKERLKVNQYKILLKAFNVINTEEPIKIIKAMIKGGQRIALLLEARQEEIRKSISIKNGKLTINLQQREWGIENGEFIVKKNNGRPWPSHLDPETVIEPLKNKISAGEETEEIKIPKITAEKLKESLKTNLWDATKEREKETETEGALEGQDESKQQIQEESPLETLIRKKFNQRKDRKSKISQKFKSTEL